MKKIIRLIVLSILIVSMTACNKPSSSSEEGGSAKDEKGQTEVADTKKETESIQEEKEEDQPLEAADNSSLVVAIPQDPDYLDPHKAAASGTEEVMFNVFEGLLKPDSKGALQPAIAKDYTISEDGKTYTFTLREGIKFHDESPVTIDDVAFSYNRLKGTETKEPLNSAFEDVDIHVIDDKTISFTLAKVDASFAPNFMEAVIPAGKTDEDYNTKPIGTGPYEFVSYIPSQKIELKKFSDYWKEGIPRIDNVEFRIITDVNAGMMSLQAGEIDLYPRINAENIDLLPNDYTYIEGMQNMTQIMAMNNTVKPLDDVRVRQAINYAIDVDSIIEGVADGKGTKLGSNMSPAMATYYQDGLQDTYNLNVDKAKDLLKEAGYSDGFDITLTVPSNYSFHVKTGEMIAEQLKAVGIRVSIESIEWSVWLDRVYKGRDYDMTIIGFTGKVDPDAILKRYRTDYERNFMNYSNSNFDSLLKEAKETTDETDRAALYKEAQVILTDEVPAVYIMDPSYLVAMKKNLKGYQTYPLYVQDLSSLYFE